MRSGIFPVMLTALVFAAGCGGDEPSAGLTPADYEGWASTVDGPLLYEIPGHTLDVRLIYINDTGTRVDVTENKNQLTYDYPDGTIILKENYTAEESATPDNLTVMIKSRKDVRARGGWIWVAKDVATGEERIFSDEFCFTCHQNANEPHPYGDGNPNGEYRDFVFYPWNPGNGG